MDGGKVVLSGIRVGDTTPVIRYRVTRGQIADYAALSTDNNPLHVDEEFAKRSAFKGIIAHGTIPLAYLFQAVYEHFGTAWLEGVTFDVKFVAPVRPGDVVSCTGRVTAVDAADAKIRVELSCVNQADAKVIVGEAVVPALQDPGAPLPGFTIERRKRRPR